MKDYKDKTTTLAVFIYMQQSGKNYSKLEEDAFGDGFTAGIDYRENLNNLLKDQLSHLLIKWDSYTDDEKADIINRVINLL